MAEFAVSFVVEKIGDILFHKAIFLKGVHEQVVRLQSELKRMQCFLKDADARQEEDERVRNWVSEIQDLAYDAEDAIDVFIFNVESGRTKLFPWRMLERLVSSYKVGKEIEAIQNKIEDISRSRETYGINSIGEATSRGGQRLQKLRYNSPLVKEEILVGLKEETDKLVGQLVEGDERRRAVSIVGMGGIGKTTLAKKVYNDSRVMNHFQSCRAWVYVSEDCHPKDVFQSILNQIPYNPTEEEARKIEKLQEHELGDFLHARLKENRFLVVLDDIWKNDDWKCLAKAFPEERNGSRLLLTTRNKDTALQADAQNTPYEVKLLSEKESWKLFCRSAIPGDVTESCPPELKEVGEKMVKKCAGLPLAIVVLGGLLSSRKKLVTVWEEMFKELQAYFAVSNGVDAILSLSYIDMPCYLKPCFLLLSLFPEDHVISARKLLFLWIAEGFVLKQVHLSTKESAEVYLNELINRNLIQVVRMSVNARVMECRVHDLVRDLAIKRAKQQNFLATNIADSVSPSTSSSLSVSCKSRRRSIYSDFERYASIKHSTPYLRSLLFFNLGHGTCSVSQLDFIAECFKVLRVLDLDGLEIKSLPSRVGKLIHLRYLGLRHVGLKTLPSSIGNLRSLQTLDVNNLKRVPNVIWKMKNLQYLYIGGQEDDVPLQIDTLQNLQILSGISFKQWSQNDSSKLTCLEKLKLEGRCEIEGVEFSNSIFRLRSLKSLYLKASEESIIPALAMNSWLHISKLEMKGHLQKLPEALQFPPSLTQLTLEASRLDCDVMPILEKLPKLLTLRLRADSYLGKEMHVSANGFAQLKVLQLDELTGLTKLNIEKGAMPWLMLLQFYLTTEISGLNNLLKLEEAKMFIEVRFRAWLVLMKCWSHNDLLSTWDYTRVTSRNGMDGVGFCRKKGLTSVSSTDSLAVFQVAIIRYMTMKDCPSYTPQRSKPLDFDIATTETTWCEDISIFPYPKRKRRELHLN